VNPTRLFVALTACLAAPVLAADHTDGPGAAADPTTDIGDVYAWMSEDAATLNLVMTLATGEIEDPKWSNATVYALHVNSSSAYGEEQTETLIRCIVHKETTLECWAGESYLTGPVSEPDGVVSEDGRFKAYAGVRNDPFFFNADGFVATVDLVKQAAGGLTFDEDGCPDVDAETSAALVAQLGQHDDGTQALDFYEDLNVLALVVQLDVDLVNQGGDLLGVWASTHASETTY